MTRGAAVHNIKMRTETVNIVKITDSEKIVSACYYVTESGTETKMKDVVIIGAGPAGMTAALYANGAGLSTVLIEKSMCGGQMTSTYEIENYPGVGRISGWRLSEMMREQIENVGIGITYGDVKRIEKSEELWRVVTGSDEYVSRAVIIANGVTRRKLGCMGESEFAGRGVSYCATCDGNFFRGKSVCVVGGGNSALEEALYLSGVCEKVWLVHRRGEFRGDEKYVNAVSSKGNIEILYSHEIKEIRGDSKVRAADVQNVVTGKITTLDVSGIFVAIGCVPSNVCFAENVRLTGEGYIDSDETCLTSAKGIFAAGDTRRKHLRQIATAVADGAAASHGAAEYIRSFM